MSTTARKLRKRKQLALRQATELTGNPVYAENAATLFQRRPKTPTPLILRSYVQANVLRKSGDAMPKDAIFRGLTPGIPTPRSAYKVMRFIASGGIKNGTALRSGGRA